MSLAPRCVACGVELRPAARFCDECGTRTGATAETTAAAQSRKDVTIVFGDLSGSTALAERMDPEAVRSVMDRYYAAVRRVVEERHGRVVKFIGDGVMAVFGVPETSEDDARRALDAGLAMHVAFEEWVRQIATDQRVPMSLRVGVNTGEVIVSAGDDDVVGDVVNVASRLEHAAEHGAVLVGEATWRLARGYARFGDVQTLTVAGRADPVRAYRLVSIEDAATDAGPEFVGRSNELDQLQHAFDEVVAMGAARLVTVLGSPGVGKTRLAAEFQHAVGDDATVLVARCAPEAAATLAPVAELLRAAAGVTDATDTAAVVQAMGALVPDDEPERERIVASAAALLGAAPSGTPEETLWSVRRLLEVAARARPVVLVIDDLHWAEPMLLDLVDHLAEWTRAPVMLMVVARPELRDVRASMVDAGRHVVVALEGLDGEATARLACGLLATDALPPGLLDRLPESTGGNPLFLRELLRMLVDDDVLRSDDGAWQLSVAPEAIDVPPTIQSLLAARLDRLPADEQALLEHASIAGKEFPVGALHELAPSGQPRSAIDTLLESLRRKELVEPDGSYWIDEPVYRFHHVLIRDAAYRRVLRQTRADLHEHLARWLEHKLGTLVEDHGELVGHHLEQAYAQRRELGGLDAHGRDVGREAAAHLFTAAEGALDREDLPAAAALAARALRCLPLDDPTRPDVLLVRCDALLAMGEATAAADAVADLTRLSGASPRLAAWCACFTAQLTTMTDPSRLRDAEQRVAAVASELERLGDTRGAAKAHTVHATTLARLGRFADVETALDRALTRAREAGDRRFATAALAAAPTAQVWGPNPVPRAGGRCLDVVRLLRITAGSPAVEATSQRCQGVLEAFRGRADPARRLVAAARSTLEELGLAHGLLETELFAGVVELVSGDLDAARQHLRVAHDGLHALGLDADAARAAALLARASFDLGDVADAANFAAEAKRLAGDDLQSGIAWRGVQAEIDARAGRHAEALALAQEAVAIASGTDALVHHADACLALAAVRRAAGDERGAEQAARDAAELYERKGATALVQSACVHIHGEVPTARAAASARIRRPSNECAEVYRRWAELFAAGDSQGMQGHVADDFVFSDPRPVVGLGEQDRARAAQTVRVQRSLGVQHFDITVVATRGDRLALLGVSPESEVEDERFGTPSLLLAEMTADSRLAAATVFDLYDVDSAMEALDARYLVGEGAACADILRAVFASNRAYNGREWDTLRSFYAPGSVSIDHRPAGQGTLAGVDAQVDLAQAWSDMVPDVRMTIAAIPAVSERAVVYSVSGAGVEVTGGHVELAFHVLERRDDDHITAMEIFSEDTLDAALSAFRGDTPAPMLDNLCLQTVSRTTALWKRAGWDELARYYAADVAFDDRRPGLSILVTGRDMTLANMRAVLESGTFETVHTPIAIRGERYALFRHEFVSTAYQVDVLVLNEVDERGVFQATVIFDVDDIDAAFAELDARYLAGEAAPHADVYRTWRRLIEVYNARDWDGVRAIWSDDLVVVDHRPGSLGVVEDRDAYQRLLQSLSDDLAPGIIVQPVAVHQLDAHGCVVLARHIGTSVDGGAVELVVLVVAIVRDGCITRCEYFPELALDEALRRFDELGPTHVPMLENLCLQTVRRTVELTARQEWEAIALLYGEDIVFEDRRPGMRTVATGRDAMLVNARAVQAPFETINTPVAVRGNRCALLRVQFVSSSYDIDLLIVNEVDEHGVGQAVVVFDFDDLDGAFADLEARYLAGEATANADAYRPVVEFRESYNRRDWDALGALLRDDFVGVDHRAAGWGTVEGRDQFVELMRGMVDLAPDMTGYHAAIYELDAYGAVGLMRGAGTSLDDSAIERLFLMTIIVRDGLIARIEFFPADALDEARARFRELAPSSAFVLDNLAVRNQRRLNSLGEADDPDGLADSVAPGMQLIDTRAAMRTVTSGREAYLRNFPAMRELGLVNRVVECLAVRGDRLALFSQLYSGDDFEAGGLTVNEVDENGVCLAIVVFDLDDLDGALAELDARYLEGEGASFAPVIRMHIAAVDAFNRRDWDALRALDAPDLEIVDHRVGQFGMYDGRDDFIADIPAMIELTPDLRTRIVAIYPDQHGAVVFTHNTATTADGGPIENTMISVSVIRNGVSTRVEYFAEGGLAAARARLAELAPASGNEVPSNRASVVARAKTDAMIRHDAAAFRAGFAPEYRIDDRRSGVRLESEGVESSTEAVIRENTHVEDTLIAIRGERLALHRSVTRGETKTNFAWEIQSLWILQINDKGFVVETVVFDVDDLDAAMAELDARYLAGEGASFEAVVRSNMAIVGTTNRGDWEGLRALHAPDVDFVDHRIARFGLLDGHDDFFGDIAAMDSVVRDTRIMTVALYPARHGSVALIRSDATSADGGPIEELLLVLSIVEHDVITRTEYFGEEALAEARARLAELAPGRSAGVEPNRAYRAIAEAHDALLRHDPRAFDALHSPDFRNDDRRSGFHLRTDGLAATTRAVVREATGIDDTLIATRGARLALHGGVVRGETVDGFAWEVARLQLVEIDADGLIAEIVMFDLEDLGSAVAELDARYLAGEGASFEAVVRSNVAVVATTNRGDWEGLRALHAPDVDFVDHRIASFGLLEGRANFFDHIATMVDVLPHTRIMTVAFSPASHGSVALIRTDSTTADGGAIEDLFVVVSIVERGTITHVEYFLDDELPAARARLAELAPEPETAVPSNRACEVMRVSIDALVRHDEPAFNATHASEFAMDDRRSGVRLETAGVDSLLKSFLRGCTDADVTLIATRGDLLVLYRVVVRGETTAGFAWEIENLTVMELNRGGLIAATVIFDAGDLDAAMAELDARYRAGVGALVERATAVPSNRADAVVRVANAAMVRNDSAAFEALHAPGCRVQDRRSGVRLEDQDVESTTKGAVRDGTGVDLTLLATRGDLLAVHRSVFRGQTREGFEWEIEILVVMEINDEGLIAETVIFDGDNLDAGMAELDARYLAGEGAPFEHVVRMNLAAVDAFNRRDWDALRTLYAPSLEMVDHRVAQFASYTDRDEFFRDVVAMVDGTPDLRMMTAAIHPDHHGTVALVHHTATTADGGAIESMVVGVSVVHNGVITRLENFPEDALVAAQARLAELAPGQGET